MGVTGEGATVPVRVVGCRWRFNRSRRKACPVLGPQSTRLRQGRLQDLLGGRGSENTPSREGDTQVRPVREGVQMHCFGGYRPNELVPRVSDLVEGTAGWPPPTPAGATPVRVGGRHLAFIVPG
ncbi:hypothetical protein TIFTF001_001074 [Ficus carica]|uniref:Uncharacterized protein n=1 Tax=Ficus carica TaxID=3494 RepID=A0AA88D3K8_FICCA|nr:hypothetical protein TIFTF001_001074 [Ficus carica]